jgi:hypothetical protein
MYASRGYAISYVGNPSDMQRSLLQYLRLKALVSESGNVLTVDTEPYEGASKGLFGFGPKWQEKIIYEVQVLGPREVEAQTNEGNRIQLIAEAPMVLVKSQVLERQNATFEWKTKTSDPVDNNSVRTFLVELQKFITQLAP